MAEVAQADEPGMIPSFDSPGRMRLGPSLDDAPPHLLSVCGSVEGTANELAHAWVRVHLDDRLQVSEGAGAKAQASRGDGGRTRWHTLSRMFQRVDPIHCALL